MIVCQAQQQTAHNGVSASLSHSQTGSETNTLTDRPDRPVSQQTGRLTDKQIVRHTQTEQTDRRTDRRTDKQMGQRIYQPGYFPPRLRLRIQTMISTRTSRATTHIIPTNQPAVVMLATAAKRKQKHELDKG